MANSRGVFRSFMPLNGDLSRYERRAVENTRSRAFSGEPENRDSDNKGSLERTAPSRE